MAEGKKFAIVIRGPAGTGKTTLVSRLSRRLGRHPCECVVLDHGWGSDEFRNRPGERYRDLQTEEVKAQRTVLIELACGELIGQSSSGVFQLVPPFGATRNAKEWAKILRDHGRVVHSFRLWAPWTALKPRILADGDRFMRLEFQEFGHSLYSRPDFSDQFANAAGIEEKLIDVTELNQDGVESRVIERLSELGVELTILDKIDQLLPRLSETE